MTDELSTPRAQAPANPMAYGPPYVVADEISLRDLWRSIVANRATLLLVWGAVLALALAYALLARPVYRAEVHLLPPLPQDLRALNLVSRVAGSPDIARFDTVTAYDELLKNLNSRALRLSYYRERGLFGYYRDSGGYEDELEAFQRGFNEALTVEVPDKGDRLFVSARYEHTRRATAEQLLDGFLAFAAQRSVADMAATVRNSVAVRREELELRIAGMREFAAARRGDRITVLREAHAIAEQLGINDAVVSGGSVRSSEHGVAVNTASLPLYTRGSDALGAEIAALESRQSDDSFIAGLRDLQEQLARLNSVALDIGKVQPYSLDQAAHAPENPVRPKRLLVVAGALVAGLFLGLMAALLRAQLRAPE